MTTSTLTAERRRHVIFARDLGPAAATRESTFAKDGSAPVKSLVVQGKPIFRSGTFSDSMGESHEWETLHMTQMVDHAALLNSRGIFSDIPIRKGHPDRGGLFGGESRNRMDELVGYMSNFTTEDRVNQADGQTYTYLLADFEILDEDAIKNISSGLWRNVSAEIGPYITNNNAEYWPVMMGVAYVDIPAVEGLRDHSRSSQQFSAILEDDMTGTTLPGAPAQPVVPGVSEHGAPTPTPQQFMVAGKPTSDFAAIQAHITNLETRNGDLEAFQRESTANTRAMFVHGLVTSNKITAPQEDEYTAFAKSMPEDQFTAWSKLMDAQAPVVITNPQGAGFSQGQPGSGSSGDDTTTDEKKDRLDSLRGIVNNHVMNHMPHKQLVETESYKALIKLDPEFSL